MEGKICYISKLLIPVRSGFHICTIHLDVWRRLHTEGRTAKPDWNVVIVNSNTQQCCMMIVVNLGIKKDHYRWCYTPAIGHKAMSLQKGRVTSTTSNHCLSSRSHQLNHSWFPTTVSWWPPSHILCFSVFTYDILAFMWWHFIPTKVGSGVIRDH